MVFTKMLLENALAVRPYNCEAVLEPLLPKVVRCILVLSSRYIGKVYFISDQNVKDKKQWK